MFCARTDLACEHARPSQSWRPSGKARERTQQAPAAAVPQTDAAAGTDPRGRRGHAVAGRSVRQAGPARRRALRGAVRLRQAVRVAVAGAAARRGPQELGLQRAGLGRQDAGRGGSARARAVAPRPHAARRALRRAEARARGREGGRAGAPLLGRRVVRLARPRVPRRGRGRAARAGRVEGAQASRADRRRAVRPRRVHVGERGPVPPGAAGEGRRRARSRTSVIR